VEGVSEQLELLPDFLSGEDLVTGDQKVSGDFSVDDARAYIAKVRWTFAKTVPEFPHWYTIKAHRPDLDATFDAFADLIREAGVERLWPSDDWWAANQPRRAWPWQRSRYHYLLVDGFEYWVGPVGLINRGEPDRDLAV
jgi:hypothetical protein